MIASCPLCSTHDTETEMTCRDRFAPHETFTIARCVSCGLRRTVDAPSSEEEMVPYYSSDAYHPITGRRPFPASLVRKLRLLARARWFADGVPQGTLLDFGCGAGDFAGVMKKLGWNVQGIEPDAGARAVCLNLHGVEVHDPAYLGELPDASFDVITLWHVLEHLHDPVGTGAQLRRLLKPGGHCLIAIPNAEALSRTIFGKDWFPNEVPRHLWHFTGPDMARWMTLSGFMLKSRSCHPFDDVICCLRSTRNPFRAFVAALRCLPSALLFPQSASTSVYVCTAE